LTRYYTYILPGQWEAKRWGPFWSQPRAKHVCDPAPPEVLGDPCEKEAQEGHVTQQFYTASTMIVQTYFYIPDLTVSSRAYKRVYKYSRYCQFVSTSADDPYCCTHLGSTPLRDAYSTSVHRASITAAQGQKQQQQQRRRQSLPQAWCQ
jgi:hypothetical protein